MIDLRSDTATRPTDGMRAAIAAAAVGDEQRREDPSVNALQERAATLLGQETALFVPTATMANQIALKLHSRPGDVLVAERHAHVVIYEYGGAAAHAGLMVETIEGRRGRFGVEDLEAVTVRSTKSVIPVRPSPGRSMAKRDMFSQPKPLGITWMRSVSPGTISVWITAGVLSRVFLRPPAGSATIEARSTLSGCI